jgi:hypothetical protein
MENQRKWSVIPTDFPFVENSVDDAIGCSYCFNYLTLSHDQPRD